MVNVRAQSFCWGSVGFVNMVATTTGKSARVVILEVLRQGHRLWFSGFFVVASLF